MDKDLLSLTHTGDEYDKYLNAVVPPIFLNSLHVFEKFEDYCNVDVFEEDNYIYGRSSNPTVHILERKIAELEHGSRAVAFASGMAAATAAIMTTCKIKSHIICMRDVYQPVKRFIHGVCIPKFDMSVTYIWGNDLEEIEQAINPNTSLIILESPATFVFRVIDLKQVADLAKKHGIKTYIDNTCLTPLFQKPLDLGIDIVMHTMSKYIGGHSDIIGGVLVSKDEDLMRKIMSEMREWFGGVLGPMEAWLAIRGIRTLNARLQQHQTIAMDIADFLEKSPKVNKVNYTGLASHPQADIIKKQQKGHTSLMSLELDTTPDKAVEFINNLHLFGKGCSWGGFESLVLCPLYKASEEELDFLKSSRGLIRLYCGLEGSENLIEDLERALKML
ncbi:MAG: Cystathionine beta-lyase/cystathionine gamma-synthase [Clostridia bacterium]|nr:Cystathionine beta-lyase/cystathionine gamma-synthase [Clostridia bacterium]